MGQLLMMVLCGVQFIYKVPGEINYYWYPWRARISGLLIIIVLFLPLIVSAIVVLILSRTILLQRSGIVCGRIIVLVISIVGRISGGGSFRIR